ncbi:MAG: hypothetical protein E7530_06445 [Ruminococcaceae bacterium]|nr:hypothetical protein [Oscillospiraceae bacterium]
MKVLENGVYREMTWEEIADIELNIETPTRKEIIVSAIREKYSVDDEIAILRQRDTKPREFEEYFNFVEKIKSRIPQKVGDLSG